MATFDKLTHNLRDTVDHLAEGWQEIWQQARNAITRFTPGQDENHPLTRTSSRWGVLSAEVRETEDAIEVLLEAPGMNPEDFDIQVNRDQLLIRGSKQYASDRKEGRFHVTERAYGRFERLIPLPVEVDEDKASAHYRKGVLELTLHKHASATPRRIAVN